MSGHNWKPGDVAMVTTRKGHRYLGVWTLAPGIDYFWDALLGDRPSSALADPDVSASPVAIVAYEDREQVKRLDDLLWATNTAGEATDDLQAALREFAAPTPPKPDEPQGLGAVVEDSNGAKWVRAGHSYTDPNWRRAGGDDWTPFDQISAVRVLSEGVVL